MSSARLGVVFGDGLVLDLPDDLADTARALGAKGLLLVEEQTWVRCIHPLDADRVGLPYHACDGRIVLRPGADEENGAYHCPDCDREVYPSRKTQFHSLRLRPNAAAIRDWVVKELTGLGRPVSEHQPGLLRVQGQGAEVQVCLVDFCSDPAPFLPDYPRRETVIYLVGDEPLFARRLPAGAPVFRLVDLTLGDQLPALRALVRRLARAGGESRPRHVPAALVAVPPRPPLGAPLGRPHAEEPAPGIRLPVPPGTSWDQIIFSYVDGQTLQVRTPVHPPRRVTPVDFGMAARKNREPTKCWKLLRTLCEERGQCRPGKMHEIRTQNALRNQAHELRDTLKAIFGLATDPVEFSQREGVRARFSARPEVHDDAPYVGEKEWRAPGR